MMKKVVICFVILVLTLSMSIAACAESRAMVKRCPVCGCDATCSAVLDDIYWMSEAHGDHSDNVEVRNYTYSWLCTNVDCGCCWLGDRYRIKIVLDCPFYG